MHHNYIPLQTRTEIHKHISTQLANYSDAEVSDLLLKATFMHAGIGGNSALVTIDNKYIFVKKIPLTDRERRPKNIMSTANLFELPLFYQYRVGSAGFGAWRELMAHTITTNWVLSEECSEFPLMYHWRLVDTGKLESMNSRELEDLNTTVRSWNNSLAIRKRLEAVHNASAHLVLFLEYFPETLHDWFGTQLKAGRTAAESAVSFVDERLKTITDFINARGFLHFDAHFKNIFCDENLFFSDFGLALSSEFDLTKAEVEFLELHRSYDRCVCIVSLVQCLIANLFGKDHWEARLREFINNEQAKPEQITPPIAATIKRYAPIALVMAEFYRDLQNETKSVSYPATQLEYLLKELDGP